MTNDMGPNADGKQVSGHGGGDAGRSTPPPSTDPSSPSAAGSSAGSAGPKWIWVLDPLTRKLRVPMHLLVPTQATAVSGTVPSLCMGFLEGRCRHQWCRQAHVLPHAIEQLRHEALHAPTCCKAHKDPHDISSLTQRFTHIRIVQGSSSPAGGGVSNSSVLSPTSSPVGEESSGGGLEDGGDVLEDLIPVSRVANTVGLLRYLVQHAPGKGGAEKSGGESSGGASTSDVSKIRVLDIPSKCVCRLHLCHRCRYLEDCNNIHICREYEERVPPPPNVLSVLMHIHAGMKEVTLSDGRYEVVPLALGEISDEDFQNIREIHREEFIEKMQHDQTAPGSGDYLTDVASFGAGGTTKKEGPSPTDRPHHNASFASSGGAVSSHSSSSNAHCGSAVPAMGANFRVHDLLSRHYREHCASLTCGGSFTHGHSVSGTSSHRGSGMPSLLGSPALVSSHPGKLSGMASLRLPSPVPVNVGGVAAVLVNGANVRNPPPSFLATAHHSAVKAPPPPPPPRSPPLSFGQKPLSSASPSFIPPTAAASLPPPPPLPSGQDNFTGVDSGASWLRVSSKGTSSLTGLFHKVPGHAGAVAGKGSRSCGHPLPPAYTAAVSGALAGDSGVDGVWGNVDGLVPGSGGVADSRSSFFSVGQELSANASEVKPGLSGLDVGTGLSIDQDVFGTGAYHRDPLVSVDAFGGSSHMQDDVYFGCE